MRTSTCICHGGGRTGLTCRLALVAAVLVWCFFRPDRPPQPVHLPLDWLAITAFVAWIIAIEFAFAWYRKWGGWSSNEFVATVALCVVLPVALVAWLGSGLSPDEHLKHDPPLAGLCLEPDDARADAPAHGGRADDHRHVLHGIARLSAGHVGMADGADLGRRWRSTTFLTTRFHSPVAAARLADRGVDRGRPLASGGCRRLTISHPKSICR